MKHLTIIFLILTILNSCSNDKTSKIERNLISEMNLKQSVLPIIKGVWVLSDYITEIEKTKSPAKSADKLHGFTTLIVENKVIGDSLEIVSSWSNHSGSHFYLYFVNGQTTTSLKTNIPDYDNKTNFYELGYDFVENDTLLFIYHYDETNKLIDKKQYTKVSNIQPEDDASWGLQYIVNEKLFSGNYMLIDSANSQTKIEFKSDGTMNGFRNYKKYHVWTDFTASGPDEDISDVIFFDEFKKARTNLVQEMSVPAQIGYNFFYKSDTLFLNQGNLTIKLLRQH